MAMSAICAPVYARSLIAAVFRRSCKFVVTPKGGSASPDRLSTFRIHLFWVVALGSGFLASIALNNTHVAMRTWTLLALTIAVAPVAIWAFTEYQTKRQSQLSGDEPDDVLVATTTGS